MVGRHVPQAVVQDDAGGDAVEIWEEEHLRSREELLTSQPLLHPAGTLFESIPDGGLLSVRLFLLICAGRRASMGDAVWVKNLHAPGRLGPVNLQRYQQFKHHLLRTRVRSFESLGRQSFLYISAVTQEEHPLEEPAPQRPLASLKWPYIPDQSAYPDPLKRDDPKTLQMHHYEAIATSPSIRKILAAHPNLKSLLVSIDSQRGNDREHALQRALGVAAPDIRDLSAPKELSEDILALRELAEAIEAAVRGDQQGALGLDWDSADL
ncbi:hypothetical protein C0991_001845 [Blastosporella zonata]|nr:hypothetical protein C0991_001845 [Blastosporella zonata]